jgi:hypothetical protein
MNISLASSEIFMFQLYYGDTIIQLAKIPGIPNTTCEPKAYRFAAMYLYLD